MYEQVTCVAVRLIIQQNSFLHNLTHLCLVDFSTIILWIGLFPIAEKLISFNYDFIEISELNVNSVNTDQTPRSAWVYTVFQCPFQA